jgi:hypothetical protein
MCDLIPLTKSLRHGLRLPALGQLFCQGSTSVLSPVTREDEKLLTVQEKGLSLNPYPTPPGGCRKGGSISSPWEPGWLLPLSVDG